MQADLEEKVQRWLSLDKNEKTLQRIRDLASKGDFEKLHLLLDEPLQFGTAGLRAEMDAGFGRMNDLTVIQASQGVCQYLLETVQDCKSKGVVIGYDHRFGSERFARLTAAVFLSKGFTVYAYSSLVHTPMVPFGVKYYKACAGIMITASHNPKQDNGYKLYWGNACQVISPHDKYIQALILNNQEPWVWDEKLVDNDSNTVRPRENVFDAYFVEISKLSRFRNENTKRNIPITYTAMHGVGYKYAQRVLKEFGLGEPIPVLEQVNPDPSFPTVQYPNPEEGAGALKLAMQIADNHDSKLIFANDPDADRLALAEKQFDGKWKIFSGNEIGAIFAGFIWGQLEASEFNGRSRDDYVMLASTVSSKFTQKMASAEGFHFVETLTGFKWIGNAALSEESKGKTVLFGFEEAIGFMNGMIVPDKDGISALGVLAELSAHLYNQGKTLTAYLESLYSKYGFFLSKNSYFICHQPSTIKKIFEDIRCYSGEDQLNFPQNIGVFKVTAIRDLTVGYDSEQPDKKPILAVSKSSQMITFKVSHSLKPEFSAVLTLRTSGTEPKIKYYSEISGPWERREEIGPVMTELVEGIVADLIRPKENGLE